MPKKEMRAPQDRVVTYLIMHKNLNPALLYCVNQNINLTGTIKLTNLTNTFLSKGNVASKTKVALQVENNGFWITVQLWHCGLRINNTKTCLYALLNESNVVQALKSFYNNGI